MPMILNTADMMSFPCHKGRSPEIGCSRGAPSALSGATAERTLLRHFSSSVRVQETFSRKSILAKRSQHREVKINQWTTRNSFEAKESRCRTATYTTIVPAFGTRTRRSFSAYQHMKLRFRRKGEASELYNLREFLAEQTHKQGSAASSSFRWRPGYPRHDTVSTVTTVIDQGPSKSGHAARQATSFCRARLAKAEDLL
jgi:hypothetical protein